VGVGISGFGASVAGQAASIALVSLAGVIPSAIGALEITWTLTELADGALSDTLASRVGRTVSRRVRTLPPSSRFSLGSSPLWID